MAHEMTIKGLIAIAFSCSLAVGYIYFRAEDSSNHERIMPSSKLGIVRDNNPDSELLPKKPLLMSGSKSGNHNGANILFGDGKIEWEPSPWASGPIDYSKSTTQPSTLPTTNPSTAPASTTSTQPAVPPVINKIENQKSKGGGSKIMPGSKSGAIFTPADEKLP